MPRRDNNFGLPPTTTRDCKGCGSHIQVWLNWGDTPVKEPPPCPVCGAAFLERDLGHRTNTSTGQKYMVSYGHEYSSPRVLRRGPPPKPGEPEPSQESAVSILDPQHQPSPASDAPCSPDERKEVEKQGGKKVIVGGKPAVISPYIPISGDPSDRIRVTFPVDPTMFPDAPPEIQRIIDRLTFTPIP